MGTSKNSKTDKIQENLSKALSSFGINVASINEVAEASGLQYRVYLMPGESLETLLRLKKDIAISLNFKALEIELSQDYATLRFPTGK